jgi:hypothetical protein
MEILTVTAAKSYPPHLGQKLILVRHRYPDDSFHSQRFRCNPYGLPTAAGYISPLPNPPDRLTVRLAPIASGVASGSDSLSVASISGRSPRACWVRSFNCRI